MGFSAEAVVLDMATGAEGRIVLEGVPDILSMFGSAEQVDIDRHHKVFYDSARLAEGVSGWCRTDMQYAPESGSWVPAQGRELLAGQKLLLVHCGDSAPVGMTDDALQFIKSHLEI